MIFYIHPFAKLLLNLIKLFFPIIVIGIITLYYFIYLKKIQISSVILLFATLFFLTLLAYPIADYYYRNSSLSNTDEFHSYLQINPPSVDNFKSANYNIFCLGGSTTEFEDEIGRNWPNLVELELNKESSLQNVRLFNLGKQWYTTQHILIYYLLDLKEYKPDAIIVMETINDLLHNADFSWLSSGSYRDDYGNFLGPVARLVKYTSLAELIKITISKFWYQEKYSDVEVDSFPGILAFERNLNDLINIARLDSTKIILMTQPNIYRDSMSTEELSKMTMLNSEAMGNGKKWTYISALNGFQQYNNLIRQIALNHEDVYLIDLEKVVPKNLTYFIDDVHYNSNTMNLISPYITEEIKNILNQINTKN